MQDETNGNLGRRACLGGLLASAAGLVAGYSYRVEPRWLSVEQVRITLPRPAGNGHGGHAAPAGTARRLPAGLRGLRIVQLSDLHRGPINTVADIGRAVDLALAQQPDLIVLTGDYVSTQAGYADSLVPILARLRAPLGVYGVLGNHDYWTNAGRVAQALRRAGVHLLRNAAVPLARDGGRIWLAGVEDIWEGGDDLPAALRPVPPGETVILLAHEPDYADTAAAHGVALQLSGHTHGGQVRLPGLGGLVLPYMARKYPIGLNRAGDTLVYTNRGIGSHPLGLRLNCRPEVTVLTLAG